jgi:hypothetical protein
VNPDVERQSYLNLPLYIVKVNTKRPPILGCDWLLKVQIDWSKFKKQKPAYIQQVCEVESVEFDANAHCEVVNKIEKEFSQLISKENNSIKHFEANIGIKTNARPVFRKAYSVPVALKPAVEKELEKQVQQGILREIKFCSGPRPLLSKRKIQMMFVFVATSSVL